MRLGASQGWAGVKKRSLSEVPFAYTCKGSNYLGGGRVPRDNGAVSTAPGREGVMLQSDFYDI
jgi:hypothetical protein